MDQNQRRARIIGMRKGQPLPHVRTAHADQAALLARIKQATVSKAQPHDAFTSLLAANEYDLADAVLAALLPPAGRAAVLREAADAITAVIEADRAYSPRRSNDRAALGGAREIVLGLIDKPSRVAAETAGPETQAARCTCQFIAESWIKMNHAADCPAASAAVQTEEA